MTLGAIEVVSSSVLERIVSITMMLLGMLVSATLVSALSASMIGLQMRMGEQQQKLLILDTFLSQNNVGPSVALRVRQQVEKALTKVERLAESDVSVVSLLSPSLRQELRFNMFGHCIIKHPLFRLWSNLSPPFVRELCTIAVSSQSLPAKHELFVAGTASNEAYVVMSGRLAYSQDLEDVSDAGTVDSSLTEVNAQEWLCEAALWMSWLHVGSAVADEDSQVLRVDASSLLSLLPNHRLIQELTGHYATAFHRRVIAARPPAPWPNDYQTPVDTFGQLISTMPSNIRATVGMVSVYRAPPKWASAVDRLKDEVLDGYSVLVLDGDGNPVSSVRRMLLELERGDGRILVQMGRRDGKHVKVKCELPQVSIHNDEKFDHGWRLLLEVKMAPFADALVPVSSHTRTRREPAEALGVPVDVQETFVRAEWDSNIDVLAARDIMRYTRRRSSRQNSVPPSPLWRSADSSTPSSTRSERLFVKLEDFFQWETVDGAGFFAWVTLDELDSFLTSEGRKVMEKEMAGLGEAEASPSSAAFFLG